MRLLLDTHAFLWFVLKDSKLSPVALALIGDLSNELLISPASYWEITVKVSLGKYQIPGSFQSWIESSFLQTVSKSCPFKSLTLQR